MAVTVGSTGATTTLSRIESEAAPTRQGVLCRQTPEHVRLLEAATADTGVVPVTHVDSVSVGILRRKLVSGVWVPQAATDEPEAVTGELTQQVECPVELNREFEQQTVKAVEGVTGDGTGLAEFLAEQFGTPDADLGESGDDKWVAVERRVEQRDTVRERIERLQEELRESIDGPTGTRGHVRRVDRGRCDRER